MSLGSALHFLVQNQRKHITISHTQCPGLPALNKVLSSVSVQAQFSGSKQAQVSYRFKVIGRVHYRRTAQGERYEEAKHCGVPAGREQLPA
jgi:hypothetical protein